MKISIEIIGQKWTVEVVDSHDPKLIIDGDVCLGTTWPARQSIYLSNELGSCRALRTMRHEMCHAFIAATQANNPDNWNEEAICDLVGIYGSQIVSKARVAWLQLFDKGNQDEA